MSYLRGEYYLWSDDRRVHFWAMDGADHWADSGWGESATARHAEAGDDEAEPGPGGVALPHEVVDDFVLLRLAELIQDGQVATVVARALERAGGNFGASALGELGPAIVAALDGVAPSRGAAGAR
jgi:hypothetical protein